MTHIRWKNCLLTSVPYWYDFCLLFISCLDCLFGLPVDIIPEFVPIRSLSSGANNQAPLNENPEDSREVARCSDPVGVSGNINAKCLCNLFQGLGFRFTTGENSKYCFVVHYRGQIRPSWPQNSWFLDKNRRVLGS
jgi:hypothetical protein